jgi:two-component system sensor kinase FixL
MEKMAPYLKAGLGMPLRISLIYAAVGALWILSSGLVVSLFVRDPVLMTRVEIFKGWAFIGLTTLLLYLLIRRNMRTHFESARALAESEERFRMLVEQVTDYEIFMLDPGGVIRSWNVGGQITKGYSPEEVIGRHHSIFFTREDIEKGVPEMELKTAEIAGRCEDEGWRVRKDGSLFWANVITTALRDELGSLRGYSKVIRDMTERKKAEDALRESQERYRAITRTASDAIITINGESTVIFSNEAVKQIFGYAPEEIAGKNVTMLMPERFRERHLDALKKCVRTGRKVVNWRAVEMPGLHRDGREIPLEISYGVFEEDSRFFFTGVIRDITERRQAEREREYGRMLEKFNREIETLVAERTLTLMALNLADKVRTPASVIGWNARKVLEKEVLSEKSKESLGSVAQEAARLEALVRDFQSVIKGKAPVFAFEDINGIIRGVLPIAQKEAGAKKIDLAVNLNRAPLEINAQKDLLQMAFFNILRNALEATPEGGRVTVATLQEEQDVVFLLSHTGPGIPEDVLTHIFEPEYSGKFYRFGMGMPLIKQIVTEHLGGISVKSEAERCTTFRMSFPSRWMRKAGEMAGAK